MGEGTETRDHAYEVLLVLFRFTRETRDIEKHKRSQLRFVTVGMFEIHDIPNVTTVTKTDSPSQAGGGCSHAMGRGFRGWGLVTVGCRCGTCKRREPFSRKF